jgi:hypothetical protein
VGSVLLLMTVPVTTVEVDALLLKFSKAEFLVVVRNALKLILEAFSESFVEARGEGVVVPREVVGVGLELGEVIGNTLRIPHTKRLEVTLGCSLRAELTEVGAKLDAEVVPVVEPGGFGLALEVGTIPFEGGTAEVGGGVVDLLGVGVELPRAVPEDKEVLREKIREILALRSIEFVGRADIAAGAGTIFVTVRIGGVDDGEDSVEIESGRELIQVLRRVVARVVLLVDGRMATTVVGRGGRGRR